MGKQIAIIGAGMSGLLACKYAKEKGFNPLVFEADDGVGGVWRHTIASTELQNTRETYQFFDFPWPPSVVEDHPKHDQVLDYLTSYANHFDLVKHIKFRSKVLGIEYVGESFKEISSWVLWGGTGGPFGSNGKWHVRVQDIVTNRIDVYQVEFVILCLGLYSGFPNIPELPPQKGPEVFRGIVMHSIDYSSLDDVTASEFIKGKRVTIVGSKKTAIDIAAQCANINGTKYPCTMIIRTAHWLVPSDDTLLLKIISLLYYTRFAEFFFHKPGESWSLSMLATLAAPIRWAISKLLESYLTWRLPLKKYGILPKCSFTQDIFSCHACLLPDKFYDKVDEGSIVLKTADSFSFCNEGILVPGEPSPIDSDVVIYATGYRGDEKHRSIFEQPQFKKCIARYPSGLLPLYRQVIHPRIPRLAVLGYAETFSVLYANEIRCHWLAQFLDGKMKLPCTREMEKEVSVWEAFMIKQNGNTRRACTLNLSTWSNDRLCKDMGYEPKRIKGFLNDLFIPYGPLNYSNLGKSN